LAARRGRQPQSSAEAEALMRRHNPAFIPRNHNVEEALVAATESLSEQTARLGALVGAFRLEGGAGSRAARLGVGEPALALPER